MEQRLIDADALKNAFSNMYREDYERWIKEVIDNAPTVEERPKGKWEYITHHARRYRVCPICKAEKEDDHATGWNFCHYCGARMEG